MNVFQRFISWIRGVLQKMLGQTDVKQALRVDVAVSPEMATALSLWALMYENKAPWLIDDIKSAGLAAAIAREIATSATIEMKVEITGSPRADFLAEQFARIAPRLRDHVEAGCAKGGLMLKPYVSGDQVLIDVVHAECFYPIAFDATGNISSCVFADQRTVGDVVYTRLEYHAMTDTGYAIRNLAFKSSTRDALGYPVSLSEIDDWAQLLPEATITGVDKPLYAYYKYPLANNIDPNSPLGISCYSRATDLIEQADKLWYTLNWEFESGRRALYTDVSAFDLDSNGKPVLPDKRLYRTLHGMNSSQIGEEGFFQEWSPEFREAAIKSGFDAILKRIEFACGLAYGTISDPQSIDKTATEVKTSRQRSYATITDVQKALQQALEQLIWAMDAWATLGNLAPAGNYSTAFEFDDSVVVDKDTQFQQDLRLVGQGIMSKIEFRMRNFGEDEKTARAKLADVTAEQPVDMFQGSQGV